MNGNNLPAGWINVELKDFVNVLDNKRKPINKKERESRIAGKDPKYLYPYYGATGKVGLIDDYLLEGEFVLLGEDGAPFLDIYKDTAYLVNGKIWVNNHAHILQTSASNKYLCYYLNQIEYREFITGTTRLKLNQSSLKKIPTKVPPLPEQHEIVRRIEAMFSELDNSIESLVNTRQQLKTYRQAVLKHAFEGKLTEKWREQQTDLESAEELLEKIKAERQRRYEEQIKEWEKAVNKWGAEGKPGKNPKKPQKPKELPELTEDELSELPDLSEGWKWMRLGNMTLKVEYGSSKKSLSVGKVPVLRMGNIQNGYFDWSDLVYSKDDEEIRKYLLEKNDVLFNRTNSPELVGKTAIYRGERKAIFAGYLIRINHFKNLINSKYLNYFLNSHTAKRHGNSVKTDGVNQSNINGEKLMKYPFPLTNIQEQNQIIQEIEQRLSVADNLQKSIKDSLQKAEALRQSILKQAFEGKLTEDWRKKHPELVSGENSAERLLERIQEEKENV